MIQKPSTKAGFHPPIPAGPQLYRDAAEIYQLNGQLGDAHTHKRLRQITYSITRLGNLVSSFQIEGIDIDRAKAARALAGHKTDTPHEADIARFGALYDEIHRSEEVLRLTPEIIQQWHARLFTKESLEQGEPGEWKTDANGVWDSEKHDFVFLATPKEDTVAELEALIRWHENEAYRLPAPIAAAILFAEFESIHPFPDGNGRLGRLLNLWALKANGLKNAFLAPIDERFKRSQDRFYAALRTTNLGDSYSAYCGYYLTQLRAAFEQAQYLGRLGDVFDELPRASARGVLEWILSARADDWFKRGDYPNDEAVSDATLTTILSELTALGFLEAQGERKGRKYRLDWDAVLAKTERAAAR